MQELFKKEDLITFNTLRDNIAKDPSYGIYVLNTAKVRVNHDEYLEVNIQSPIADDSIDAALNINIGTMKEPHLINIAPTWIPISLADHGDPVEIIKTQGFKTMVEARYITLVSKEAYERIMEDEGAQAVRDMLLSEKYKSSANSSPDQLLAQLNKSASKRSTTPKEPSAKKTRTANLSAIVYEFSGKEEGISHNNVFQKYKSVEPKLSVIDLEYIIKNTTVAKIKKAAELRLSVLK